ncbi:MAG: YggS family pyridoxal phosphate-dependent enzyme [Micromonosporaceae bacterium]|nr:YggS family pyridoxal phosphate-dependent enzyme [Micromonosporaceae bacterium]
MTGRTEQLAANLARVRARIAAGAAAAGRDPDQVTLVAVTKTYPASDVVRLARLGVTDIGENRDQEAAGKAAEVDRLGVAVRWHFVGRLQRNKARSVVRYAELVHSVDSARLAAALAAAAAADRDRPLAVLVQVSVDADPARGGVVPDQLAPVADAVAAEPALRLAGVMTVAPPAWEPAAAFGRLAELAERVRADHPSATAISAGMSGDLEAALACGATHVRIGSDLLGKRAPLG